jgi:hypothetical protein
MGVTRRDDFLSWVHFHPKRTYIGKKPVFGVFWEGRGTTG